MHTKRPNNILVLNTTTLVQENLLE